MDEIPAPLYPEDRPMIMGDDDGSAPRLVLGQAYAYYGGHSWRKGQSSWVVGTDVEGAIANHIIAPVAGSVRQAAGTQRPGEQIPELGIHTRIGTQADTAALTAGRSHVQTFPAPAEEPTYDLDADPVPAKRGPGRPRKPTV